MARSTPADLEDVDTTEWEQVARRLTAPLRGFFTRRVRNPADVDDMVQEVFVQLMQRARNQPEGAQIERLEQYTFQAAANLLRDQHRRDQVRHRDAHDSYDADIHDLATHITPERIAIGDEGIARVTAVLEGLPERTRDVFMLRWTEKASFEQIARMLGISSRAAQRHMAVALKHLGEVLG